MQYIQRKTHIHAHTSKNSTYSSSVCIVYFRLFKCYVIINNKVREIQNNWVFSMSGMAKMSKICGSESSYLCETAQAWCCVAWTLEDKISPTIFSCKYQFNKYIYAFIVLTYENIILNMHILSTPTKPQALRLKQRLPLYHNSWICLHVSQKNRKYRDQMICSLSMFRACKTDFPSYFSNLSLHLSETIELRVTLIWHKNHFLVWFPLDFTVGFVVCFQKEL